MAIPFAKPFFSQEDIEEITYYLKEILNSGWLTSHKFVQKFEEKIAEYVGAKHAIATNSCTAALHSIMLALGIGKRDEVIVPANSFVATANIVLYTGAKPVFADVDPKTFNISLESVRNRINDKTKGIVVVHVGGNPAEMDALLDIAKENNLFVVEDAAHALGSLYEVKHCGTLGGAGAFSFYPTKVMTTGEGGMVVTNNNELAEKIKMIRNHGRRGKGAKPVIEKGYNYRMPEISAAIGLVQMRKLEEFISHRNKVAELYNKLFEEFSWIVPQEVKKKNRSTYYAYIMMIKNSAPLSRDKLAEELSQRGVGTSIIYHPIHLQPFYKKKFGYKKGELPVSEAIGERSLSLPMYSNMPLESVERVVNLIKKVAKTSGKQTF